MRWPHKSWHAYTFVIVTLLLFIVPSVTAAAAISEGFHSAQSLSPGTLVERKSTGENNIIAATIAHQSSLLGIVVASNSSTIATSSVTTQTQIVTQGQVSAYVTDLNGAIKTGDPVTISPITGVGMKATTSGTIVGMAAGNTVAGAGTSVNIRSTNGTLHKTTIQLIPINIAVENYTPFLSSKVPGSVQSFFNSVANRPVSLARLVTSSLVLLFAALAVVITLYTGIHHAFVAIGRNPLAKYVINRALLKTIIGAMVIVGLSLTFAYLILVV